MSKVNLSQFKDKVSVLLLFEWIVMMMTLIRLVISKPFLQCHHEFDIFEFYYNGQKMIGSISTKQHIDIHRDQITELYSLT